VLAEKGVPLNLGNKHHRSLMMISFFFSLVRADNEEKSKKEKREKILNHEFAINYLRK
jgi:hypothetical protein